MDIQTDRWMDKLSHKSLDGWRDDWTDGWTDRWLSIVFLVNNRIRNKVWDFRRLSKCFHWFHVIRFRSTRIN